MAKVMIQSLVVDALHTSKFFQGRTSSGKGISCANKIKI